MEQKRDEMKERMEKFSKVRETLGNIAMEITMSSKFPTNICNCPCVEVINKNNSIVVNNGCLGIVSITIMFDENEFILIGKTINTKATIIRVNDIHKVIDIVETALVNDDLKSFSM